MSPKPNQICLEVCSFSVETTNHLLASSAGGISNFRRFLTLHSDISVSIPSGCVFIPSGCVSTPLDFFAAGFKESPGICSVGFQISPVLSGCWYFSSKAVSYSHGCIWRTWQGGKHLRSKELIEFRIFFLSWVLWCFLLSRAAPALCPEAAGEAAFRSYSVKHNTPVLWFILIFPAAFAGVWRHFRDWCQENLVWVHRGHPANPGLRGHAWWGFTCRFIQNLLLTIICEQIYPKLPAFHNNSHFYCCFL